MSVVPVARHTLRDRRTGLLGWALGIAAYVMVMASVYPAVRGSAIQRAVHNYPDELKAFFGGNASFDFRSATGYLNVELFSLVLPALLAIVAIAQGAATLAGEEESGFLDLVLAHPVPRRRVLLEQVAAVAGSLVSLGVVMVVSLLAVGVLADLDLDAGNVVAAVLGCVLIALFLGALAVLVGAAGGRRPLAIGVPTVVFAASYLAVGLAGLVDGLSWLRQLSLLYHATGTLPISNGLPANFAVLAGAIVVVVIGAVVAFDRHDLTA
jgi:ABC-2 type transport system permease protein